MADGTLIFDTKLDNSGIEQGLNQAESGFQKTGGMASKFGKVAAAAGVAAAGAMVALGKKSLELYSDYEQLKGGVETMYKESSDTVMQYAQNAYKTAGMSANEYMDTVTSFSASLISSLGGDTEKAAKVGDMAIRDMSDNANKFGTDIGRIQDAYQGFAKGNFTMLDNLKLGYAGTKEGMEQLLSKAEELTGKKYDINNLSDIYEAIHAVQTEWGITGTTAAEAADTIQGSIGMMKGAWENLLTGLGDPEADIDKLLQNLIESIEAVAKNVLPRISLIFKGLLKAVQDLAPMLPPLIQQMLPMIIDAIISLVNSLVGMLPAIFNIILQALPQIIQGILTILPQLIECVAQLITMLAEQLPTYFPLIIEAVMQIIPMLLQAIPQILLAMLNLFMAQIKMFVNVGKQLIQFLWNGVKAKMGPFVSSLVSWAKALPGKIKSGIGTLVAIGTAWLMGLWNSVKAKITALGSSLAGWAKQLPRKIKSGLGSLFSIGANFIAGFINGIKSKWENVTSWIHDKISAIPAKIRDLLGIGSPSRVMAEIGKWIPAGLAVGIEDNFGAVENAMAGLSEIPSNIDVAVPSIRPVGYTGGAAGAAAGGTVQNIQQTINFNEPVQTPAQTARVLRENAMYGLAGA